MASADQNPVQNEGKTSENPEKGADNDLDQLLDSVLEDFDKPLQLPPKDGKNAGTPSQPPSDSQPPAQEGETPWSEEFLQQASSEMENVMKEMLKGEPNLLNEFKCFAENAAKATSETTTTDTDFATNLSQTLKGLAENAEALNETVSEDELAKMFSNLGNFGNLGADGAGADMSEILPFMTNMMQTLLCKEMLYPAIHEIVGKYPDWLADNRSQLPEDEYSRYNRQYELMKQVCQQFESESDADSDEVKKHRFDRILELMQQMQQCGNPPKDLVGDLVQDGTGGVEMDEQGNLKLPNLAPGNGQCPVM